MYITSEKDLMLLMGRYAQLYIHTLSTSAGAPDVIKALMEGNTSKS
jgi:hypothetical protein